MDVVLRSLPDSGTIYCAGERATGPDNRSVSTLAPARHVGIGLSARMQR